MELGEKLPPPVPLVISFSTALPGMADNVSSAPSVGGFTDVKSSDYFADAVLWAVEKNITSGTSKTTFSGPQSRFIKIIGSLNVVERIRCGRSGEPLARHKKVTIVYIF